jgi:hypothetical protein
MGKSRECTLCRGAPARQATISKIRDKIKKTNEVFGSRDAAVREPVSAGIENAVAEAYAVLLHAG